MTANDISRRLEAIGFKRITTCDECEQCLFFRKEEKTVSLADSGSGTLFTISKKDWEGLCKKIKSGEVC